ncbi:MAG: prepilin peptidase [Bdellovibrionales bacterium]
METIFFPGPIFGWIYLSILFALLMVAAYIDWRWVVIPKWLTLSLLGLALLFNMVRGALLGSQGHATWILGISGPAGGVLEGLLYTLAGTATGFGLYFLMWILGACGGGDVKLSAALGGWIGPYLFIWILMATVLLVGLLTMLQIAWGILTGKGVRIEKMAPKAGPGKVKWTKEQLKRRKLVFSLPLALACIIVLPWFFRFDLRFMPRIDDNHAQVHLQTR